MTSLASLPWMAVGVPVAVALAWFVRPLRPRLPALAALAPLPALALALVHLAVPGAVEPIHAPALVLGLSLGVDVAGGALLLLVALLWTAAGVYAWAYHRTDPRRTGFFTLWAATLAGNVGVVLAWDLLSFYLAFALLTFAGWGLVVHDRDAAANRAGRVYIALALLGEVAILSALLALGAAGGGVLPGFQLDEAWVALGGWAPLVAALAVAGFGVKAGLIPLHLWLPLAHPVAPTAASALLSGVMVKAGVLGWMRILPAGSGTGAAGEVAGGMGTGVEGALLLPGVGEALLLLGVVGAFWGVVCGLAQVDPKAILAYSTVSQMGYLAMGAGLLVLLPREAPWAVAALLVYALHHGFAKGALFLSVGVADRVVAPGRLSRGWLRLGVALPALALAGAPLTSGVLAKGMLKDGLAEVAASPGGVSPAGVLGPVLLLAAAGTAVLLFRYLVALEARVDRKSAETGGRAGAAGTGAEEGPASEWVLVLAWGGVVLAGVALSPILLAGWIPLPEGATLPGLLYDPLSAILPLGAGVLVGWGGWKAVRSLGAPGGPGGFLERILALRIPPGDLVVPVERLLARRPRGAGALSRVADGVRDGLHRGEARALDHFDRLARQDLVLMRGPFLGIVLLGAVAGVVLAVLLG